ncbi:MAG: hypothetical protein AAGC56_15190 [Pseudomonadota bacterium]
MKRFSAAAAALLMASCGAPDGAQDAADQPDPSIGVADFAPLNARTFSGLLTYRDYQSDGTVEIPVVATVDVDVPSDTIRITFEYPEEPQADNVVSIEITDDGRTFGGETVVERRDGPPLVFVTTSTVQDAGADADARFTYTIDRCGYSSVKDVRPVGADAYFERNRFELRAVGDPACN